MTKHFFPRILTIDGLILEYFLVNSRQKKTIFLYFILIPCTSQDSLLFFSIIILSRLSFFVKRSWSNFAFLLISSDKGPYISVTWQDLGTKSVRAFITISLLSYAFVMRRLIFHFCFSHFVHLPLKRRDPQIPLYVSYFSTKIFFLLFFIFINLSNAEMT